MVCTNGRCENTEGSFRCVCEQGLSLDSTRRNCIGKCKCCFPMPGKMGNLGNGIPVKFYNLDFCLLNEEIYKK